MKPSEFVRKGWCQGTLARTLEGKPCSPKSPKAQYWCLIGALAAAPDIFIRTFIGTTGLLDLYSWTEWNDDSMRIQQDVIEVLERFEERVKRH